MPFFVGNPASVANTINAIATFSIFQLVGEVLARLAALLVPGPALGLLLLLLVFALRGAVPEALHTVSSAILRHLSLLFVPAGVRLVLQVARIRAEWEAIAAALVVSTALTLLVIAAVFRLLARSQARNAL